jgi:hypothetical protein
MKKHPLRLDPLGMMQGGDFLAGGNRTLPDPDLPFLGGSLNNPGDNSPIRTGTWVSSIARFSADLFRLQDV